MVVPVVPHALVALVEYLDLLPRLGLVPHELVVLVAWVPVVAWAELHLLWLPVVAWAEMHLLWLPVVELVVLSLEEYLAPMDHALVRCLACLAVAEVPWGLAVGVGLEHVRHLD